jgi:pimeloyl-ACP methyl ester carboxylesterase
LPILIPMPTLPPLIADAGATIEPVASTLCSPRELQLELPHLRLAARAWGEPSRPSVLALHGWLDNGASFDRLAPSLDGLKLVALDLPGHGRSDHRPPGATYHFVDWCADVLAAAEALGWQRFAIVGHSLGAGVAAAVAAAAPERVERLVLIEGIAPLSSPPAEMADRLARSLREEERLRQALPRAFPDLEGAVTARMVGSDLDRESARVLVQRATVRAHGEVHFTHDPRLKIPSRVRLTEEQVLALLGAIRCPVLAFRAREGWPFPSVELAARLAAIPEVTAVEVDGGHHVHLTHPERVAERIREFLA